jgi:predicted nucleic acid-binding protein
MSEQAAGDGAFDSNVLLYLLSDDAAKARRSEALLAARGVVSVQVLNECFAVARRKLKRSLDDSDVLLALIKAQCTVVPLTLAIHERGRLLHARYRFQPYDSMILAAALAAGCTTLWSEDMHHGMVIDGLTIRNPYLE